MEFAAERMKRVARGWNSPTAERGDELVHNGAQQKEDKLERDVVVEQELDRNCEMFSLLMNYTLSVIREEKRRAQKGAERLVRG
jgi:hypothetical protein